MKKALLIILFLVCLVFFAATNLVFAESAPTGIDWKSDLKAVANPAYGLDPSTEPPTLTEKVGSIINVVLTVIGMIIFLFILYGGFLWMTSAGSEDKIKKAKGIITNAVIGLVIVLVAYAATNYIMSKLVPVA